LQRGDGQAAQGSVSAKLLYCQRNVVHERTVYIVSVVYGSAVCVCVCVRS